MFKSATRCTASVKQIVYKDDVLYTSYDDKLFRLWDVKVKLSFWIHLRNGDRRTPKGGGPETAVFPDGTEDRFSVPSV